MSKKTNNTVQLQNLLEMAQGLLVTAHMSSYTQGDSLIEQYQRLFEELSSIDPKAKRVLPDYSHKGSGMFIVDMEEERQKAILASNQIVSYLRSKLSEESDSNASIVIILDEGKVFDAWKKFDEFFKSAKKSVRIIDSYVDDSLFPLYFHALPDQVSLEILTKNLNDKFKEVAKKYKQQHNKFEVKISNIIHDRYLIIDNRVWVIGQSIKDAGKKPLTIVEINETEHVTELFSRLWSNGSKII